MKNNKIPLKINSIKVPADQVVAGDVMKFRMSKFDTIQWLQVQKVIPGKYVVGFQLENGCFVSHSIRNKSDWATIIPLNSL